MKKKFKCLYILLISIIIIVVIIIICLKLDSKNKKEIIKPLSFAEVTEKLLTTKKIEVSRISHSNSSNPFEFIKYNTITNEVEINTIVEIISNSEVYTGPVNYMGPDYELKLFDKDNVLITEIRVVSDWYLFLSANDHEYCLVSVDFKTLLKIMDGKNLTYSDTNFGP